MVEKSSNPDEGKILSVILQLQKLVKPKNVIIVLNCCLKYLNVPHTIVSLY
jgi:hypothetical protein